MTSDIPIINSHFKPLHFRLQTTTDFPIHLSYKTGHFEALHEIPKSSTTTDNHLIGTLLIIFTIEKIWTWVLRQSFEN